ncbi:MULTISPECIES: cupin domain-containing protein [Tenebrionibacter/Tenebrionicola group]|jgi:glucose-6-phosphate isomerase|uniref:Glucose-6-phosphate isomerase n=2 Tax=Tenebrionibacter/Tenebrionicola group TaxID=2969848 RepID=A0A8K0XXN0_9ENTR|nr:MULTISPECIES: glucose-6-phosphate isomerase [Tenebrionibacter/Tenebrionicola group]MBK4716536.1 glucose-6-phosphate isomerase [Tenebrionibacter intestinalis]MBV5097184.1 glucose-6-phosphate isomerase [Tenebrionicola larvae]
MNPANILPPQVMRVTGTFTRGLLTHESIRTGGRDAGFVVAAAWREGDPLQLIVDVKRYSLPAGGRALYVGVTYFQAQTNGDEFFITRGHFHPRCAQGGVYFCLRGQHLQPDREAARLAWVILSFVYPGPPATARRLIHTGDETRSPQVVWPVVAWRDYATLSGGAAHCILASPQRSEGGKARYG